MATTTAAPAPATTPAPAEPETKMLKCPTAFAVLAAAADELAARRTGAVTLAQLRADIVSTVGRALRPTGFILFEVSFGGFDHDWGRGGGHCMTCPVSRSA